MNRLRAVLWIGTATFLTSLLLARVHPFGDASLYAQHISPSAIPEHTSIPPPVREVLVAKCADCHSSQTRTPIYGRVAPISWLMERDILKGREHLNLAMWDSYTPDQQQIMQAKILQEIKADRMPLPQYRLIHQNARINAHDLEVLKLWIHIPSIVEPSHAQLATGVGNFLEGRKVFERRCTGCHSFEQNREGPNLHGIFGATAGKVPSFIYSPALKSSQIVWDDSSLDRWLADPDAFLPGNNMDFHVANPQERKDLIRFFRENATTAAQP